VRNYLKKKILLNHFIDQLTMNVPQGAKRRDDGSKISIKVEETSDKSDSFETDKDKLRTESIEKSISEYDKYKIKIKTINKEFLDKDTKLQIELIDENGQSIFNQTENDLQKGKIDTITLDTNKDFGKV
jgi:hypothetical protein